MSFHKKYETCLIIIHATSRCHFFLLTQIFSLNVCNFNSFDLDEDQKISETELSTLIDITGAEDLDEFFEKLDVNKGKMDIMKRLLIVTQSGHLKMITQYNCCCTLTLICR